MFLEAKLIKASCNAEKNVVAKFMHRSVFFNKKMFLLLWQKFVLL